MNILSIGSSFPRYEGDPTAPFVESITRALASRGHTIHLVLPENAAWSRPDVEGSVHYHLYRYSPARSWTPWGYSASLARGIAIRKVLYPLAPVVALSAVWMANRVLSQNAIDVVQVHWIVPNGPIGAYVARRHRLPLVVSMHGSDIPVAESSRAIGRATRWTLATTAGLTAPSYDLLRRARRFGAVPVEERIHYGADADVFAAQPDSRAEVRRRLAIPPDAVVVAGIGRFVAMKGFGYLLRGFAAALEQAPDLRLLMVGDGDMRRELAALAGELELGSRVVFAGMADRDEIPAYFAAADIVAVPSIHHGGYVDGLPNVALEAMAAGKPLIATGVGGLPEVVRPGENGLLVAEQDAAALAGAMVELARDPHLCARMGKSGRELVRSELSWDAAAARYESVFERVVRG